MMAIAVVAQKGGTTKTTTAVQLALALVREHHRAVLVIDLDDQADATSLLLPDGPAPGHPTVHQVLHRAAPLEAAVVDTRWGVDLLPATEDLEALDLELANEPDRSTRLLSALSAAPARWDYVLIDGPRSLGLATVNALVAARAALHPVTPANLSLRAVKRVERTLDRARALNPRLVSLGYVLTAVDGREAISVAAREQLGAHAKHNLWEQEVAVDASLKLPLGYRPRSRGVVDYEEVARELVRRLRYVDAKP